MSLYEEQRKQLRRGGAAEEGRKLTNSEMESESDEETREWERTLVERGGVTVKEPVKPKAKTAGYIPTPSELQSVTAS